MALKSHDWRLLFSRADIFSFELQVQPQRKRKTKGLSAGRQARQLVDRDKLCFDFFFFCMEEKAFEKSNGWDCCLQKGKKIL